MILLFLLHISSIFAKKGNDGNSTVRGSRNLLEMSDKIQQVDLYGQPRFNTSCDLESLEAAYECEQYLQSFFSDCSENCEDQSCVSKCQRDFYINVACKSLFLEVVIFKYIIYNFIINLRFFH